MDKYYVMVAGAGRTSRANVEALIDDYVYANGQDVTFLLPYETSPAPGQVFISQWAKDKSKDVVIFSNEGAKHDGISSASMIETDNPLEEACKFAGKVKTAGFVLWNKDEPDNDLLNTMLQHDITPYDLSEGLNKIPPAPEYGVAREREQEPIEPVLEPEEDVIDVDDIIRRVTKAVLTELDASKKASKGSRT